MSWHVMRDGRELTGRKGFFERGGAAWWTVVPKEWDGRVRLAYLDVERYRTVRRVVVELHPHPCVDVAECYVHTLQAREYAGGVDCVAELRQVLRMLATVVDAYSVCGGRVDSGCRTRMNWEFASVAIQDGMFRGSSGCECRKRLEMFETKVSACEACELSVARNLWETKCVRVLRGRRGTAVTCTSGEDGGKMWRFS
jgi:hypothetical protein